MQYTCSCGSLGSCSDSGDPASAAGRRLLAAVKHGGKGLGGEIKQQTLRSAGGGENKQQAHGGGGGGENKQQAHGGGGGGENKQQTHGGASSRLAARVE
jgi:hypothetical protein